MYFIFENIIIFFGMIFFFIIICKNEIDDTKNSFKKLKDIEKDYLNKKLTSHS